MKTRISPRDWEALSAYLDGQLSPKERSRLEKHLRSSADLRAALEELRRTRALLRSQPRLKSPRNFTLTPEMVGRSSSPRGFRRNTAGLYPVFSMASALAGLLFVVILVADLLNFGPAGQPMMGAPAANEAAASQEVALFAERQAAPESAEVPATEAPAAAPAAESQAQSQTGTPLSVETQPAAAMEMAAPNLATETPLGLPTTSPSGDIPTPAEAAPEVQKAVAPTLVPAPSAEAFEQSQAADMATTETQDEASLQPFWTGWRMLEAALAVIAIATGLAAFLLRRT